MNGTPQFDENYSNPEALEGGVIDFPYDEIDHVENVFTDEKVVSAAIVQILAWLTEGDMRGDGYLDGVADRAQDMETHLGGDSPFPVDPEWLLQWVDGARQILLLRDALSRLFSPILCSGPDHQATRDRLKLRVIAMTWVVAPSLLEGLSLKALAEALSLHPNTLSIYTSDISRAYGYRSHGQSKGWNWQKEKGLKSL